VGGKEGEEERRRREAGKKGGAGSVREKGGRWARGGGKREGEEPELFGNLAKGETREISLKETSDGSSISCRLRKHKDQQPEPASGRGAEVHNPERRDGIIAENKEWGVPVCPAFSKKKKK